MSKSTVLCRTHFDYADLLEKYREKGKQSIVFAGKIIFGTLKKGLPHLLYRPWERIWLKRSNKFKAKIMRTKESFQSVMRCLNVWPSVPNAHWARAQRILQKKSSWCGLQFNTKWRWKFPLRNVSLSSISCIYVELNYHLNRIPFYFKCKTSSFDFSIVFSNFIASSGFWNIR